MSEEQKIIQELKTQIQELKQELEAKELVFQSLLDTLDNQNEIDDTEE